MKIISGGSKFQRYLKCILIPITYNPHNNNGYYYYQFPLYRNIHLAYNRVAFNNFSLSGLVGNEIGRRVVGIYGTGAIGIHAAKILKVFIYSDIY